MLKKMMNKKEWAKYLDRDLICPHCGTDDGTLVPQHRANRGMGGSHKKHKPSNILVFCSYFNGQIESNPKAAEIARTMGWKLESWQNASEIPFYCEGKWYLIDDNFNRIQVPSMDLIE